MPTRVHHPGEGFRWAQVDIPALTAFRVTASAWTTTPWAMNVWEDFDCPPVNWRLFLNQDAPTGIANWGSTLPMKLDFSSLAPFDITVLVESA